MCLRGLKFLAKMRWGLKFFIAGEQGSKIFLANFRNASTPFPVINNDCSLIMGFTEVVLRTPVLLDNGSTRLLRRSSCTLHQKEGGMFESDKTSAARLLDYRSCEND